MSDDESTPIINALPRDTTYRIPAVSSIQNESVPQFPHLHVYRRRWYILTVFSLFAFMQGELLNTWTVIAEAAHVAFGWDDNQFQLMQLWLYLSYLLAMIPFAWLMLNKGLRPAVILSSVFMVIGTALRCISSTPPVVTWLAHSAHFVLAMGGPVAYTAGPTLSSLWFPANQRSTATAVSVIAGYAGGAACFLFGPQIVEDPLVPVTPALLPGPGNATSKIDQVRQDIMLCRYIECGICIVMMLALMVYFPSHPPKSPSLTSAIGKLNFTQGLRELFSRNSGNFWLICLSFCLSVSIYGVWSGLFGVMLKDIEDMSEHEIGWLGFSAVAAGSIGAVFLGRLMDLFVGRMKLFLLFLNVGCILSTLWFITVARYVAFSKVQLFAAAIIQGLCNNGAIPLYNEMAIESTYPVAEVCVTMAMSLVYNTLPMIFLLISLASPGNSDSSIWMSWCLYAALLLSFPLLLTYKEQYRRLMVDKGRSLVPESLQNSIRESRSRTNSESHSHYETYGIQSDSVPAL